MGTNTPMKACCTATSTGTTNIISMCTIFRGMGRSRIAIPIFTRRYDIAMAISRIFIIVTGIERIAIK